MKQHAFRDSRLYKMWADCNMVNLAQYRRSDQAHFDFYTNLGQDLKLAIQRTNSTYGVALPEEDADLHICLSHRKRKEINHHKQYMFAYNQPHVWIPDNENEHGYRLCIGTQPFRAIPPLPLLRPSSFFVVISS